jgi:hypothetical protein
VEAGIPAELTKGDGVPGLLLAMLAFAAGDHQDAGLCLLSGRFNARAFERAALL